MYTIGICDDEPVFLENLSKMTADIMTEMGVSHEIRTFSGVEALEGALRSPGASMDLLLLDILMPGQNGIMFAGRLRLSENRIPVIFISTTRDFALDGYKVDAVGYLIKPVPRAELKNAIRRARRLRQDTTIALSSPARSVSFRLNEVLYLDIRDKELAIHMEDGSILHISVPLNSLLPRLPADQFIRCYRSYIVSLPAVSSIWRYSIRLKNGETIPVSRAYYSAVQGALMDWASRL